MNRLDELNENQIVFRYEDESSIGKGVFVGQITENFIILKGGERFYKFNGKAYAKGSNAYIETADLDIEKDLWLD